MESNITMYEYYEKRSHSPYNRRLIDGTITGCGKCVGYCQYCEHPGFLTKELRKQHNCLGKECHYYVPKERTVVSKPIVGVSPDTVCKTAQQILSGFDYLKIVRAVSTGFNQWCLDFVTISNDKGFIEYAETIEEKTGASVVFRKLDWSFEKCEKYILQDFGGRAQ